MDYNLLGLVAASTLVAFGLVLLGGFIALLLAMRFGNWALEALTDHMLRELVNALNAARGIAEPEQYQAGHADYPLPSDGFGLSSAPATSADDDTSPDGPPGSGLPVA